MFNQKLNQIRKLIYTHDFIVIGILSVLIIVLLSYLVVLHQNLNKSNLANSNLDKNNKMIAHELGVLKTQDQYVINKALEGKIGSIEKTYSKEVATYERIIDLRDQSKNTKAYEKLLTESLSLLSKRNYSSAEAILTQLNTKLDQDAPKGQPAVGIANIATNVNVNNSAPGQGYSRQKVQTEDGEFVIDIIAADLSSTRVIVDTASDSDCKDNCPVLSLGEYAGRSGAFAGINGSYFCPASYPTCAGKTNSFDTLLMNKNKHYFNSDNNVYSNVPAAIFSGSSARFVGRSLEWGRDTGVDSVIANQPLLLSGGNIVFGGDSEVKRASRGARSFIGNKGSIVYIGVVSNANVAEVAIVLKKLGLENALNLDSGGSTALWSGGYKFGPGRGIPNAVLFVRR